MNTIETVFKKLGHLLDSYLPSLLQIIFGLGALCATCLDHRSLISPASVNLLKMLRQMTITRLIQVRQQCMFPFSYWYANNNVKKITGFIVSWRIFFWVFISFLVYECILGFLNNIIWWLFSLLASSMNTSFRRWRLMPSLKPWFGPR